MIDFLPTIGDGIQYHGFTPMLATLYGRDEAPYRFLRIVDKGILNGRSSQVVESGNYSCVVENVDIETYLTFLTYGYTPYVECALTGYSSGIELDEVPEYFISQAVARNYEKRVQTLLSIAENKRLSLLGGLKMAKDTSELCDELEGALAMWEMLMNTGTERPRNCLELIKGQHKGEVRIPLKRYKEKYEELEDRTLYNNFANIPFKITDDMRNRLLSAFGCR